ncbi:MAG: hypothetical protein J6Y74_02175 [Clostridia bacterium]|nr:hypothetical protein [Clostridia bacterium]
MRERIEGKRLHFIGVGGISMSALIKIASRLGAIVSGSDRASSERFESLLAEGYDVYLGERPEMAAKADLVVYTAAIAEDHPERRAARGKEISRADFLAEISALFEKTVAVAGTHGKTTVSAMISSVLAAAGTPFSAHIGGVARNFGSNLFLSGREIFVTEACEYKDSFLSLTPDLSVVLNAEIDHGDYFSDEESVFRSFRKFVLKTKSGGTAILGEGVKEKLGHFSHEEIRICSYGDDFMMEEAEGGLYLLDKARGKFYFSTTAKGRHNRYNAAVAAEAALLLGVPEDRVRIGLASFLGVKRRYEPMGCTRGGASVFQDYAHHPSEIAAVADVARGETQGRLILVFEPHTYSRTAVLFSEFIRVLSAADVLVLLPTYSAREVPKDGVDARALYCAAKAKEKYYFTSYDDVKKWLDRYAESRDTVLLLGAGSIEKVGEMFRRR